MTHSLRYFPYLQVSKPAAVSRAEQAAGTIGDDQVLANIVAYAAGVSAVNRVVRQLLPDYDGYECKEPEPGKFTLAFRCGARVDGVCWTPTSWEGVQGREDCLDSFLAGCSLRRPTILQGFNSRIPTKISPASSNYMSAIMTTGVST